ncbi:MAG: hypothetical protein QM813_18365 [Verrucomicrobiota bacterium]
MNTYRVRFGLLLALLAGVGSGCVGHRNALKSQTELRAATTSALTTVHSLQAATIAELQAHQQTRETLREVASQWQKTRRAAAILPVTEAKDAALLQLQTLLAATLEEFQVSRHEANKALTETINKEQGSLAGLVKSAKAAADETAGEATKYPNDLKLALASTNAQLQYVAIAAKVNTEELRARIRFTENLNAAEARFTTAARKAVETQRQTILTAFTLAAENLNAVAVPQFSLGPELATSAAAVDGLIKYLETVELTAEAMEDYLQSNSLGKGSFFHGALKAFGKGVFTALPIVGTGQGATLQEVQASGGELLRATQDQFKQTAQAATDTARAALKETLDDAKASVSKLIENKLGLVAGSPVL